MKHLYSEIVIVTTSNERLEGFVNQKNDSRENESYSYFAIEGGRATIPSSEIEDIEYVRKDLKAVSYRKQAIEAIVKSKSKSVSKPKEAKVIIPSLYSGMIGIKRHSKIEQCISVIVNSGLNQSRASHIESIMSTVGMSKAGASTYHNTAKKAICFHLSKLVTFS